LHRYLAEFDFRYNTRALTDGERAVLAVRGGEGKWPAPGSEDTELGVLMEPEVGHGETEVYPRVQA